MEANETDVEALVQNACDVVANLNWTSLERRMKKLRYFEGFEESVAHSLCEKCGKESFGIESVTRHHLKCVLGLSKFLPAYSRDYNLAYTLYRFLVQDEMGSSYVHSVEDAVLKKIQLAFVMLPDTASSVFLKIARELEYMRRRKATLGAARNPPKPRRISPSRKCYSPNVRDSDSRDSGDVSDEDNVSEEEYRVEAILDTRRARDRITRKSTKQYLVKWAGYDEDSATWEPWMNLRKCKKLVKEFEDKQKKRRKTSFAKSSKVSHSINETQTTSICAENSPVRNRRDFLDELVRVTLNQGAATVVDTASSVLASCNSECGGSQVEFRSSSPILAALESLNRDYQSPTLGNSDINVILENWDYGEVQFDESGSQFYEEFYVTPVQEEPMPELSPACRDDVQLALNYPSMPIIDDLVMEPGQAETAVPSETPPSVPLEDSGDNTVAAGSSTGAQDLEKDNEKRAEVDKNAATSAVQERESVSVDRSENPGEAEIAFAEKNSTSQKGEEQVVEIRENTHNTETNVIIHEQQVAGLSSPEAVELQESVAPNYMLTGLPSEEAGKAVVESDLASLAGGQTVEREIVAIRGEGTVTNGSENPVDVLSSSEMDLEESVARDDSAICVALEDGNQERILPEVPESSPSRAEGIKQVVREGEDLTSQECERLQVVREKLIEEQEEEAVTRDDAHWNELCVESTNGVETATEDVAGKLDEAESLNERAVDSPALAEGGVEGIGSTSGHKKDLGVEMTEEMENSVRPCDEEEQVAYSFGLYCAVVLSKITTSDEAPRSLMAACTEGEAPIAEPGETQKEVPPGSAGDKGMIAGSPLVHIQEVECEIETQPLDLALQKNRETDERLDSELEGSRSKSPDRVGLAAVPEVIGSLVDSIHRKQCEMEAEAFNLEMSGGSFDFLTLEKASSLQAVEEVQAEAEPLNLALAERCSPAATVEEPVESVVATGNLDASFDSVHDGHSRFVVTNASASDDEHEVRLGHSVNFSSPAGEGVSRDSFASGIDSLYPSSFNRPNGPDFPNVGSWMQAAIVKNCVPRRRTMCAEETPCVSLDSPGRSHNVSELLEVTAQAANDILQHLPVTPESMAESSPRGESEAPEFEPSQKRATRINTPLRDPQVVLETLSPAVLASISARGSWKVPKAVETKKRKRHSAEQEAGRATKRRRMLEEHKTSPRSPRQSGGNDLRFTAKAISMAVSSASRTKLSCYDFTSEEEESDQFEYLPLGRTISRFGRRLKPRRMSPYGFLTYEEAVSAERNLGLHVVSSRAVTS